MVVKCAKCGGDNPTGMRFCGGCGANMLPGYTMSELALRKANQALIAVSVLVLFQGFIGIVAFMAPMRTSTIGLYLFFTAIIFLIFGALFMYLWARRA